jgi:adenine-specific DNA-methyltransferase
MFREAKPGLGEIRELISELNPQYPEISEFEKRLRSLFKAHKDEIKSLQEEGGGVIDDWKGIYNYNRAEYRDESAQFINDRDEAERMKANIWVWREDNPSMPQIKEDSQKAEFRDPESPEFRFYRPIHPKTQKPNKPPKRGWAWPLKPYGRQKFCFAALEADHRIAFGEDENKIPQIKRFLHEVETNVSKSVIEDFTDGEKELTNLFGTTRTFGGPKPSTLIGRLIVQADSKNSPVLDFFAGSGTTGQATFQQNRLDGGKRSSILVEGGAHFDTVLLPRMKKISYADSWKDGQPISLDGLSHVFEYFRLESYEDALNNLTLKPANNFGDTEYNFARDYMLHYWLDFETKGSPSLLNIEWFTDPTAYKLKTKKPGTDEYVEKAVDLMKTFNWLIGLHVEHLDRWRGYDATFKREIDPELPKDANTRLILAGSLKEMDDGPWRFRKIEGYRLRTPGDQSDRERALVIWRKLTDDLEKDNLMLDEWFKKYRLSTQDSEFDVVYVNGSNNLPNLRQAEETWKVRLIEEHFHQAMWDVEEA